MMREYPAYGRAIASHIVRGQKPIAVAVLLSSYWGYFNHVAKVCIKPGEWAIGRYELGFLRGLHAVAVPGDGWTDLQLAELLVELMRAGPALLWVFGADGTRIYDGDDCHEVALYALQLAMQAGAVEKLSRQTIQTARRVMAQAQLRAGELWQREYERVKARGDAEATTRWMLRDYETKDRVRELFAAPRPAGDARAA